MEYTNGDIYIGYWNNDQKEGVGWIYYTDR